MSSPEPRELPSPVQLGKDFRPTVDRDFSARPVRADDVDVELVAVPKATTSPATSSVTAPVPSQTSGTSSETGDLIPPPEDHTAPVEPGPSQLPSEEESLPASNSSTSPGVSAPRVSTPPIPTSSSPSVVK